MRNKFTIGSIICLTLLLFSCSTKKNTKKTRLYHEINTRYNIYYNAEIAYNDALEAKNKAYTDNLSEMISVYPVYPEDQTKLGGFETTIDKCVKAIKLHSIQSKPERNSSKRRDVKYKEWLQQKEFNPFLKTVWLLMAKSEYQSLDYIRAISTFSYITRLFKNDKEVVAEANLWIANAYTQMEWYYEADNIFHRVELAGGVPNSLKDLFSESYANYLVRSKKYEESLPYLQQAIKGTGGTQSLRLKYLLGQVYAKIGNKEAAYQAFDNVQGLSTPYLFSLNAMLQQAGFIDANDTQKKKKTLSSLSGMTGKKKNEEFLDQIYYSIGNIYFLDKDTVNTIKNYGLAIEKSTRSGYDKAIAQVALGDIYFQQKDYVKAQPLYPDALGVLGKKHKRYTELSLRSEVLDELAVYAEALHLQDSLQTLARMPEDERLLVINKIIEAQKKKDKDEAKDKAREDWEAQNPNEVAPPDILSPIGKLPGMDSGKKEFYFYSPHLVAQGKAVFKKQWGNRKLEDNWRRKDKASTAFADFEPEAVATEEGIIQTDSIGTNPSDLIAETKAADDKYSPEFYLAQLPLTEATMAESNDIIEDAYYQMGLIYKNKLGDFSLAIEAFETVMKRFPKTKNLEEIYYQLFLIYSQRGDKNMADLYRNKLISEFPESDYAITLADPNYEWILRNMSMLENELYEATYQAYLAAKINTVRENYTIAKDKFPLTSLMPKFMFLNTLTYAQTNNPQEFKDNLKALIDKYPKADVTPLASDMLKGILGGKSLVAGGPMRGMIWDVPFTGEDFAGIDSTSTFVDNQKSKHRVLLIFDPENINRNDLIYNVADYNFSNFTLKTFDLSFSDMKPLEILQIQGLESFRDVSEYMHKAFEDSALIERIDPSIVMIPISDENYTTLSRGRSLGEYIGFFNKTYGASLPKLTAYWSKQMQDAEDATEVKETAAEAKPQSAVDDKQEPKTPIIEKTTPPVSLEPIVEKAEEIKKKLDEGVETIVTDETIGKVKGTADDVKKSFDEVMDNPVDGIKNIISRIKDRPKLTKEEKEALKEEKKIEKELKKAAKAREKATTDSINAIEKERLDSIKMEEEMAGAVERAKEDARKAAIKEKEDSRKARQQELKDKERAQSQRLKDKEQERKDRLKQLEKEREEKRKARESELKEKERIANERKKR